MSSDVFETLKNCDLFASLNEDELQGLFSQCGEIVNVNLIKDRSTGRSKGFGFVEFATSDQAQSALKMDGQEFQDRPLKVSLAREQQRSGGGDRDRRGGGGGRRRW